MLKGVFSHFTPEQRQRLAAAWVGVAGAGGLGSNAAMMLARSGVGHLLLVDGDSVEPSNLNRQHYFPRHLGRPKVEALAEQLRELNPDLELELHMVWLDKDSIPRLLDKAELWLEALDDARTKALFASAALKAGRPVICGSGMGGFGGGPMGRRSLGGRDGKGGMLVVGDFQADTARRPPLAPRVMQCAAMQADAALEWICTGTWDLV